ncbi:hypothetical protein LOD99_13156 [Oopsacas minuta]|uniref:Dynein regulatory complex subunit 7 n=1 Tax=Oopsacas minuta TaxID=111878 RepID=A0AAV7JB04_9METZ|nr:hypothetical protein LOD99_13156 [Oopsacas minuta]
MNSYERELKSFKLPNITENTDKSKTIPASYTTNNESEEKALSFANNFKRQYMHLYQDRKPLFLSPLNEHGIGKMVCTSLRPTQLKFKRLYDFDLCAQFVADYLTYQFLEKPTELPQQLTSITQVLDTQEGNCFEYSHLLCSLLLGAGYDAYVVSGYATRDITLFDLTSEVCPLLQETEHEEVNKTESTPSKYLARPPRSLESGFKEKVEKKRREAEKKRREAELAKMSGEDGPKDELSGMRIHSWVLVLSGSREVPQSFFLEPTTGQALPLIDKNYEGIESIWNNRNYWVNMQLCINGCRDLSFDLGNALNWEYFLPNVPSRLSVQPEEVEPPRIISLTSEVRQKTFELPPSWLLPLDITEQAFETRLPKGKKSILYKKCRLDKFAPYTNSDALVGRLTMYGDISLTTQLEVREWYQFRMDKLQRRTRYVTSQRVKEEFGKGRPLRLREHTYQENELGIEGTRTMEYYGQSRVDGLMSRELNKFSLTEYFKGRDDLLLKRQVEFGPSQLSVTLPGVEPASNLRPVTKFTLKYDRDSNKPANEDIQVCIFSIVDNKISIQYHLEAGRITANTREFIIPESSDDAIAPKFDPDCTTAFKVDRSAPDPKIHELAQLLDQLIEQENANISDIRKSEEEVCNMLSCRSAEEQDHKLEVSVYDTVRNEKARKHRLEMERQKEEEERLRKEKEMDYLAPYLAKIGDPKELTSDDAEKVYNSCLSDFKNRLISMAQYIQTKYEKERQSLETKQCWYQSHQGTLSKQDEEEYLSFCSEAMFKIHTLEQRLNKHKDLAQKRFAELKDRLHTDSRLVNVLYT